MKSSTIAGLSLIAGAALIEAALIPGLVIGAAVVLAPRILIGGQKGLPRRRSQTFALTARESKPVAPVTISQKALALASPPFEFKQAIFKTITFRMVATSFDFAANIVVIGNFTTAVSFSAFGLIGAPMFYLCHEILWNRAAPAGTKVNVGPLLSGSRTLPLSGGRGLTINRTLAKTITYEIVTTTVDFSANYVATRDIAAAAGLTVFAAVISPFLYYGHEKVWDYFSTTDSASTKQRTSPITLKLTTPSRSSIIQL